MERSTPQKPLLNDALVYVTGRCNLRCAHCYYEPMFANVPQTFSDEVSCKDICGFLDELMCFGLRTCKLSGGEPFMRQDIVDICIELSRRKISVNIECNGTLVTSDHARRIAACSPGAFISVSLDGGSAKTHDAFRGVHGALEQAVRGLMRLVEAGLATQVISALYPGNEKEIRQVILLCAEMNVGSIKVNPISPVGRGKNFTQFEPEHLLKVDQELCRFAEEHGLRYCSSLPIAMYDSETLIRNRRMSGACNIESSLGLLADGTITICGMGRYCKDFCFGKLGEVSVADVWVNNPLLARIRRMVPYELTGICGRCVFRSQCKGYCRICSETSSPNALCNPHWFCAEMETKGMFPKSRIVMRNRSRPANAQVREGL